MHDNKSERITRAHFVFVARDPTNTSSVMVNQLLPEGEREKHIMILSASKYIVKFFCNCNMKGINVYGHIKCILCLEKNEDRKRARQNSILNKMPTPEEQSLIYETFMKTVDHKEPIIGNKVLPADSVWMNDTTIETNILCHPEVYSLIYLAILLFCLDFYKKKILGQKFT